MSLLKIKDLVVMCNNLRNKGKKIVFTNGCFDILHKGHLHYLFESKKLGDYLIVGLNSDKSVKTLKGAGRPINNQEARAKNLLSKGIVDNVVIFDEPDPHNLIEEIVPSILTKGSDYRDKDIIGSDIVESNNGTVVLIPFLEGYSTTNIINNLSKKPWLGIYTRLISPIKLL